MTHDSPRDAVHAALRGRRTIHAFRPEAPARERVLAALELARWAPNHRLTEPWRFHLLGPETARALVELNARLLAEGGDPAAAEAKRRAWSAVPGWLVVTCRISADPLQMQEDRAACACAIQNLQLALWSDGIGVKWTTGRVTRTEAFRDLVWVDGATDEVVGLLMYGHPAEVPEVPRRALAECLVELP